MRKACFLICLSLLLLPSWANASSVETSYVPYSGTINSTVLSYFEGVMSDEIFNDYVICRVSNYEYLLIVGSFEADGGVVSGTADFGILYTYGGTYNNSTYVVDELGGGDVRIDNTAGCPIYSNVGNYAEIERGGSYETIAWVIILCMPLFLLIRSGFGVVSSVA